MERKYLNCIHFPCYKTNCEKDNKEVCDLYETEVSRAIKSLKTDGCDDWEGMK